MPILSRRTLGVVKFGGAQSTKDPSFVSITQTNNITSVGSDAGTGNERILFDATEPGTSPTVTVNDISADFSHSNGTFTASTAGDYFISVMFIATISGTSEVDVRVIVEGVTKHTKRTTIHASVDPTETTTGVILSLDAGDTFTITYEDDGTADVFVKLGTSVNVMRIGNVGSGGGGGGGGSGITINNNVAGYILKATGDSSVIEGMPQFVSSSTGLTASVDFYISGSSPPSAGPNLFIQGSDAEGNISKMKVVVENGFLKIIDDNLE